MKVPLAHQNPGASRDLSSPCRASGAPLRIDSLQNEKAQSLAP